MSIRVMSMVWDADLPRNQKMILLAYADHADDEGRDVYPSVGRTAWKTGYSERAVQQITRELEEEGILIKDGKGPRGTNKYTIELSQLPKRPEYGGEKTAPPEESAARGVQKSAERGAKSAPEPSVNHQLEPSGGERGAHAREETPTPPKPQTSLPQAALQHFEHLSEREEDMAEPQRVWNGIIDLCEAFCEHSEERLPDLSTYSGAKADNWVRPADYLLRLVGDDADEAVSLVKDTLSYMDHHGLAYSNLASIKSVARKIERGRANGTEFSVNGSGNGSDRRTEFWEQYILPFCERRKEFGELPEHAREIIRTIGGDGVLSDELKDVRIRYYQSVKENPYAHADA